MRICLLFLIIFAQAIFGEQPSLRERLGKAKQGDYIVTEMGKTITLLSIRSITPSTLILEEISAPSQNLKPRPDSWAKWVKSKAPGHSSWSMIEIDLQTGDILECYSFSRSAWIRLSPKESLIATLLPLPLQPMDKEARRKIGPAPLEGEPDVRKIWNPPLTFEGKTIESPSFEVFTTLWPQDDSELSNRQVALYFDQDQRLPLPFWIQVETSHLTGSLRTIDSGQNLLSPHRSIPRRVPEFVGLPLKTENGLHLSLKSPKYYREFELFAVDVTDKTKKIYPIEHTILQGKDEWLTVAVSTETLKENLLPEHKYTWLLVPLGHSESYTQSSKPFTLWTQ